MRKFIPIIGLFLIGCGVNPGKNPDQVDVTGSVTQAGKPITGLTFNLQVVGTGTPAVLPVKDGRVEGKLTPGRYTWFISEGNNALALRQIPQKYLEGALDRQISIAAGTTLDIKLD